MLLEACCCENMHYIPTLRLACQLESQGTVGPSESCWAIMSIRAVRQITMQNFNSQQNGCDKPLILLPLSEQKESEICLLVHGSHCN